MNDFPIHGKSRIRLSWGRSQGDKQVEHVRKLASALGVPFDAVWRMVQGQDNSTIKQIATAVGTNGANGSAGEGASREGSSQTSAQAASARMDLRAVANAAGLSESEVLELVKNGTGPSTSSASQQGAHSGHSSTNGGYAGRTANGDAQSGMENGGSSATQSSRGGPYSRVSPSSFGPSYSNSQGSLPISPPPTGGPGGSSFAHHQMSHPPFSPYPAAMASPSPYTAIRPESYVVQPPAASAYERVDFVDGGRPSPNGFSADGPYQSRGFGAAGGGYAKWQEREANGYAMPPAVDDQFAAMNLGGDRSRRHLPPPASTQHSFQPTAPEYFPGALASPTTAGAVAPGLNNAANWSWNGFSAA